MYVCLTYVTLHLLCGMIENDIADDIASANHSIIFTNDNVWAAAQNNGTQALSVLPHPPRRNVRPESEIV